MDQNTREVLMIAIPTAAALVSGYFAARAARKVDSVSAVVDQVKHQTDGLTEKLVGARTAEATLVATAAEKEAQAGRENEQAKGAAAARQADAGVRAEVPLTMAVPPPKGDKK